MIFLPINVIGQITRRVKFDRFEKKEKEKEKLKHLWRKNEWVEETASAEIMHSECSWRRLRTENPWAEDASAITK